MSDIFISYSRRDSALVDEFVRLMEGEGFRVWIDRDGIESGDAFKKIIVRAIKESGLVVFFSSEYSNASSWTAKEISVAVHHGKTIIPIKIDNTVYNDEVEFDLVSLDYIDYTDVATREAMKAKLLRTLRAKLPERWNEICAAKAEADRQTEEIPMRERIAQEASEPKVVEIAEREGVDPQRKNGHSTSEPNDDKAQSKGKAFFQKAWPWGLAFLVFEIMYAIIIQCPNNDGFWYINGCPEPVGANGLAYGIAVSWPFILLFAAFFWLIKRYSVKLKALPWVVAGLSTVLYVLLVLSCIH